MVDTRQDLALGTDPDDALEQARAIELLDRELDGPGVTVLRWPGETALLADLRDHGRPRLLLLASTTPPVVAADLLEDWVRMPVSVADLRVRLRRLRRDADDRPPRPWLDGQGRLVHGDHWIGLSPRQERLAAILVARFGQPVPTRDLRDAGHSHNALRCCLSELRRPLGTLGLTLTSLRNRGYLLHGDGR